MTAQKTYIEIYSLEEAGSALAEIVRKELDSINQAGRVLKASVPFLTKEQAAFILNGSTSHIDNLERGGFLQRKNTKSVACYDSLQVWNCFLDSRTGRLDNFSFKKLMP